MSGYEMRSGRPGGSGSGAGGRGAAASFSTQFFNKGSGSQSGSRLFTNTGYGSASGPTIVDEERRLIDKVFAIVDKDNSGHVDTKELKEMFKLFGLESRVFDQTIEKIMNNVDKDFDGTISAAEFYK